MTPTNFPQANCVFAPPEGLTEDQCSKVYGYRGEANGGSMDGAYIVVTAWMPSVEDINQLIAGNPVFLTCVGGLPPHTLSTNFEDASNPA